ncbi:MAG: nuclear transport factor 2 family protein [Zhongshania sp.]|uniref:nuclear transport factor 2 family protein n=1 Tax=Zhongshania sp. TaxID=1971902 RepID=UPI00260C3850|nr:nuclear transport factor 2 family protein [Zhongshania sp.]MDF1693155.1 nuclear transport factor 2 family protein [Zhongshania sp.]
MNVVDKWHKYVEFLDATLLDEIIDKDAVFFSPVVHSAQRGEKIVKKYLSTAMALLNNGTFVYTHETIQNGVAVLEFELEMDGVFINGVDIIHFNDLGKITEFKVMVRPLQGIMMLKELMAKSLSAPT